MYKIIIELNTGENISYKLASSYEIEDGFLVVEANYLNEEFFSYYRLETVDCFRVSKFEVNGFKPTVDSVQAMKDGAI